MGTAFFTCKCGVRVDYDTSSATRPKYCHQCMMRITGLLISLGSDAADFKRLYSTIPKQTESRQVKLA